MSDLVPHLADLADKINAEHQQAETALRAGLEHAKNAGELLLQAKRQCWHGEWLPWLAANVQCSERTAQAYMRVAKRWAELQSKAQFSADLTLDGGLKLLAAPATDDKPKAQGLADLPAGDPDRFPLLADEVIWIGQHGFRCPFAGICPDIDGEAWTAFKWSIRKQGIRVPIRFDENLDVLDGRQRLRAAAELGLSFDAVPFQVERGLSEEDKIDLYVSMNLFRTHRSPEETESYLERVRTEMETV